MTSRKGAVVFGAADGLVLVLGIILGLAVARQPALSVWHAALGGGLAEVGGMALGQYWSDPERDKTAALANGAACAACTLAAGSPFAAMSLGPATAVAAGIISCLALVVTWLREEKGLTALAKTFGMLLVASALAAASGPL